MSLTIVPPGMSHVHRGTCNFSTGDQIQINLLLLDSAGGPQLHIWFSDISAQGDPGIREPLPEPWALVHWTLKSVGYTQTFLTPGCTRLWTGLSVILG